VELVSSDRAGSCRADCTTPLCGDARLDPGEVCDDGNDVEGDGCSGCRPELP
jgi:cysteine-rich repeat protein